jgi:hypothetical protein
MVHLASSSYALYTSTSASGFLYQYRSGTRGSKFPNGRDENAIRNGDMLHLFYRERYYGSQNEIGRDA